MGWLLLFLALIVGTFFLLKDGINSNFGMFLDHLVKAAFVHFIIGTIVLFILILTIRKPWPSFLRINRSQWWIWTSGLLGVFIVISLIMIVSRIGVMVFFSLVIKGQVLASLFLDHYGLIEFNQYPFNFLRLDCVLFLLSGVVLIQIF